MLEIMGMNLVELLFVQLTVAMVFLGFLMNLLEPYLPNIIVQTFRYGKFASERKNALATKCEIPKSSFKHFYLFAAVWAGLALYFGICVYISGKTTPTYLIQFLDLFMGGSNRPAKSDAASTFVALLLMMVQTFRRFYETHFVQVFSKTARINITHYLVGYLFYFGMFVVILGKADGFTQNSLIFEPFQLDQLLNARLIICSAIFLYSWMHQFMSNLILSNLRRNKTGKVITEKHLMPTGGYFELVSSPHMFFELMMYLALYGILYKNCSFLYVVGWVFFNQIEVAHLNHKWYKATFSNYPKQRKAFIPFIF